MKIAIVGGTHGNEPVGVEVMKIFKDHEPKNCKNDYTCFFANPRAYKEQKRFIDSDLNRAFGKNAKPRGYEKKRAEELRAQISGQYDFVIDLHTTTTNMGLTVILNNTNELTQKVSSYLKLKNSSIRLIEEDVLDEECTHLNRLASGGITIEVGPVANNVCSSDLVFKMKKMVNEILEWNFKEDVDYSTTEHYKVIDQVHYPEPEGWYVHPDLEGQDFKPLKPSDPIFINSKGEINFFKGSEVVYPFFINEAAYQNNRVAMILSKKIN